MDTSWELIYQPFSRADEGLGRIIKRLSLGLAFLRILISFSEGFSICVKKIS